jgi:dihydrofolate reductase
MLFMKGGTTFHFVTEGIEHALALAREAAQEKDIRLGGGVATLRQYLLGRYIDEMHLAFAPVLLGSGETLLADIHLSALEIATTFRSGSMSHASCAPFAIHISILASSGARRSDLERSSMMKSGHIEAKPV